jgi:O-acetyl-ADP-ribose deacetylase (regulator of RNase III)
MYQEIEGDLIKLALQGKFEIITHGCNCFCTMGAGIAPQMAYHFGCNTYPMEAWSKQGDIRKLGSIDYIMLNYPDFKLTVVNSYTQYYYGKNSPGCEIPLDYSALELCLRKINHLFKPSKIGLPQIGCGLAGGQWEIVKGIIQKELKDCDVTVVIYKK